MESNASSTCQICIYYRWKRTEVLCLVFSHI